MTLDTPRRACRADAGNRVPSHLAATCDLGPGLYAEVFAHA